MNSKAHIQKLLQAGKRLDGRAPQDYREPVSVEQGYTKTAEGSARVCIGDTQVIAGVKLEVGTPYPDSPDEGSIMVGAELLPLSSPEFEPGPPGIQSIELARVVDRGIRESGALDLKKLCIESGEKAWIVIIDVVTINDAGNLFDACAMAAMAALKDAKFPTVDEDGKIDYKNKTDKHVPVDKTPLSVTVLKIGDQLIVDPLSDEEKVAEARLTCAVEESGTVCALQKGGDVPFTPEEIMKCIDLSVEKTAELRKHLA